MASRLPRRTAATAALLCAGVLASLAVVVGPAAAAGTPMDGVRRFAVPATALQAVLVRSSSWSSTSASVGFYERDTPTSPWREALPAVAGRVGYGGMHDAATRRQSTGTTPAGIFNLPWAFGGAPDPGTRLAYRQFDGNDWWVYDPRDPASYNRYLTSRPAGARWRTDWAEHLAHYYQGSNRQYTYAVVLDYNLPAAYSAPNTSKGGGIFLHVNGAGATAGCISVPLATMKAALQWLDPAKHPVLVSGPTSWLDDAVATPAGLSTVLAPAGYGSSGSVSLTAVARPARLQWWRMVVTNACTNAVVDQGAVQQGVAPAVARWDGSSGTGPAPPGVYRLQVQSGTATTSVTATRSWTVEVFRPGATVLAGCPATRVAGTDRYATAVEVGRVAAPASRTIVLAGGENAHLVDGLVAAPLAASLHSPLLLTAQGALPGPVAAEVTRRGVTRAVVVGSQAAVSNAVVGQLHTLGVTTVDRIGGNTRYDTAALVALQVGDGGGRAFVASGEDAHLVDALAGSGPAAALDRPILLTAGTALPTATASALTTLGISSTDVLGGTGAVDEQVLAELPGAQRWSGASRYATAAAVAGAFAGSVGSGTVVLASGSDPVVDALPGGALGRLVLLTGPTLPSATAGLLRQLHPGTLTVLGGPNAVQPGAVRAAVQAR